MKSTFKQLKALCNESEVHLSMIHEELRDEFEDLIFEDDVFVMNSRNLDNSYR